MPGEKIRPLTRDVAAVSIEYTLPARAAQGDLVRCGGIMGFTLAAGKKGDVVPVMVRHKLVDFPMVGTAALTAGDRIEANKNLRMIKKANNPGDNYLPQNFVGLVHRDAAADADRIELCFIHD